MDAIVVDGGTLADFIQRLITTHAPGSTLVICASQEDFLQHLHASIQSQLAMHHASQDATDDSSDAPHPLLVQTLGILAMSRTLRVAFCPTLPSFRAYLSQYCTEGSPASDQSLVLVGVLTLHKDTASWSAQGLSRTIAIAVDAAHRNDQQLLIFEPPLPRPDEAAPDTADHAEEEMNVDNDSSSLPSIWEQQVSILNVTTRSFGAAERGWVGRTIKVRQVAERWCRFVHFED